MKAEVRMSGTNKRKNLVNKRHKSEVVPAQNDPSTKPPPFRFGKLAHNEAKLLSGDLKRSSREDKYDSLVIIGHRSHTRINAKLKALNEAKAVGNGYCKKLSRVNCLTSDVENGACRKNEVDEKKIDAKIHEDNAIHTTKEQSHKIINVSENSKENSSRMPISNKTPSVFSAEAQRGRCNQHGSGPAEVDNLKKFNEQFCSGKSKNATVFQETHSKKEDSAKSDYFVDEKKEEGSCNGKQQSRDGSKDKRKTSLVKQKSKRVPTRHIKYVSELDENLRNKYRRHKDVIKTTNKNKPLNSDGKAGGKRNFSSTKKAFGNQTLKEQEKLCDTVGVCPVSEQKDSIFDELDRPNGKSSALEREPCLKSAVMKNGLVKSALVSKSTQAAKSTRIIKSAPASKTVSKNVESFLVRNGLIPKAGSSVPGKPKTEKTPTRKKSVKLILSRSRAKSLQKKYLVDAASRPVGKEVTVGKKANAGLNVGKSLNGCWKVCGFVWCMQCYIRYLDPIVFYITGYLMRCLFHASLHV